MDARHKTPAVCRKYLLRILHGQWLAAQSNNASAPAEEGEHPDLEAADDWHAGYVKKRGGGWQVDPTRPPQCGTERPQRSDGQRWAPTAGLPLDSGVQSPPSARYKRFYLQWMVSTHNALYPMRRCLT
jgi:hypothetical protein